MAKRRSFELVRRLAALLAVAGAAASAAGAAAEVSGPYRHHNLAVYLVHGPDRTAREFLTLDAALEGGQVVVHETSQVNELAVENVSREQTVFVQAGDIVKGGRQDRVLSQDLVLKPRSGRVPIAAFCVESGRWQQRGSEAPDRFLSSKHVLSSKELKLAARHAKSQAEVWEQVEALQKKLAAATGAPVASSESATSLPLSLESRQLAETRKAYVEAMASLPGGHADAVGVAIAINGKLSSAEVYATASLFRRLWPKLLDAAATEAVAAVADAAAAPAPPAPTSVTAFLDAAARGAVLPKGDSPAGDSEARESHDAIYFESRVGGNPEAWLHRSYLARPGAPSGLRRPEDPPVRPSAP